MKGLSWGFAAIGNAIWSGPRLRDVLLSAGVKEDDPKFKHVHVSLRFANFLFLLVLKPVTGHIEVISSSFE